MFSFHKQWIPNPVDVVTPPALGLQVQGEVIEVLRFPLDEPLGQDVNDSYFPNIGLVLFGVVV